VLGLLGRANLNYIQWEAPTQLSPLERANLNHWICNTLTLVILVWRLIFSNEYNKVSAYPPFRLGMETDPVSETSCPLE
jgi:hypothetical protein